MTRLDRIRERTAALGAGGALVSSPPHVRWACGFSGSNGLLLVVPERAVLFTDARYTTQAAAETGDAVDVEIAPDLVAALGAWPHLSGLDSLLVDADTLTVARFQTLSDTLALSLRAEGGLLEEAVAAKDETEIDAIRRAQAVTVGVFESLVPLIVPGVSERDLAAEIVYLHMTRGAASMAFEPIVASGPRGALPHARPSARTLRPGDLVVIDMGGVVDGYCADMTRTVAVGEPSAEMRRAYDAVEAALQAAMERAAAGVSGAVLDRAARSVLAEAGLGEFFSHSLGHGIGMEVHEWPRLSSQVEHTLPAGACVTLEPGVYLPERFGIRTEDLVVVREGGAESLTSLSRDLVVV